MSTERLSAALTALQSIESQVQGSRAILLLELESQGWKQDKQFTGGWCFPDAARPLYMLQSELITKLTNDSIDPNYIHMITHLLRCGWQVANQRGDLRHPEWAGVFPPREALITCISVATGTAGK